jgi:hypothetical protein
MLCCQHWKKGGGGRNINMVQSQRLCAMVSSTRSNAREVEICSKVRKSRGTMCLSKYHGSYEMKAAIPHSEI